MLLDPRPFTPETSASHTWAPRTFAPQTDYRSEEIISFHRSVIFDRSEVAEVAEETISFHSLRGS